MGPKFQGHIKLLPELLNDLSKFGGSTAEWTGGVRQTFGKRGTRTTVGLPGTEMSHATTSLARHFPTGPEPRDTALGPMRKPVEGGALREWLWKILLVALIAWVVAARGDDVSLEARGISAGPLLVIEFENGVMARGTWAIPDAPTLGERIADPVNTARIVCDKALRRCTEAWAKLQHRDYLHVDLTDYDVTDWTKQEVTAETAALCATSTLTINLLSKEVFRITRNGGLSPDGCKRMSGWHPLTKPVIEKLVDGATAMLDDPRTKPTPSAKP